MECGNGDKRVRWIDVARGYGIILVVLGHSVTTVIRNSTPWAMLIYNSVYYFHMPFLFFLSGYAFKIRERSYEEKAPGPFLADKAKRLLVPYISYSLLIYIIFVLCNIYKPMAQKMDASGYGIISFGTWLIGAVTGGNEYCQHLWYIYSLFIISVVAFALLKIDRKIYKYILLIVSILFYYCWSNIKDATHIDVLWKTAYCIIWFSLGLIIDANSSTKKNVIFVFFGLLAFVGRSAILMTGRGMIFSPLLNIFIILSIIIFLCEFSKYTLNTYAEWIGKNSYGIYLFHQPFFGSALGVVLFSIVGLSAPLSVCISIMMSFAVPVLVIKILNIKKLVIFKKLFLGM